MSLEYFLATGILLGITAGIAPGPLLMLVISETMKHGRREGVKVALAPLITDSPIILAAFLLVSTLSEVDLLLGTLALAGAGYLFYLGIQNLRIQPLDLSEKATRPSSLLKGVTANFLNPNPYIFWASVGTPIMLRAFQSDLLHLSLFLLSFYFFIVASKVVIAFLVQNMKQLLATRGYIHTLRTLGIALILLGFMFARDAFHHISQALAG